MSAPTPGDLECTVCQHTSSPHGVPPVTAPAPGQAADDPFGGHEFHYEPRTDLFRCIRCHVYEIVARAGDGPIEPCEGTPPAGSGPIEVNAL